MSKRKPVREPQLFTVGVFEDPRRSGYIRLNSYVRDFNPSWKGCCQHKVMAITGAQAKRQAETDHRATCMK